MNQLIACDGCGGTLGPQAHVCPRCGQPGPGAVAAQQRATKASGNAALILLGLLAGCGFLFWQSCSSFSSFSAKRDAEKATETAVQTKMTANFKVLRSRLVRDGSSMRVIGEVQNTGGVAAGVELEITSRDENGVKIDSKKFWPNSVSNVPPGKSCDVGTYVSEWAKSFDLKVVDARVW